MLHERLVESLHEGGSLESLLGTYTSGKL